jgi:PTH1 family peptidyl-tRNA hydrolase
MKLVIGLGNPEPQYDSTRHNIGFWALDGFAATKDLKWKRNDKFRAHLTEYTQDGEKVILAKPATYYNLVGESARAIADFYKIAPEDILVVHDDLALPLGTIRTRVGGSDGGNNGLKSLNAHIGEHTHRLRIGVWIDDHEQADKVSVVLGKLSRDEQHVLAEQSSKINLLINDFVSGTLVASTHRASSAE